MSKVDFLLRLDRPREDQLMDPLSLEDALWGSGGVVYEEALVLPEILLSDEFFFCFS